MVCSLGIPTAPAGVISRRPGPSPPLGEKRALMQYLMRKWNCRNCRRPNATEVALDRVAKCDHCAVAEKIQPSRARGGETPSQLAEFIQAGALCRQGEWT